MFAVIPSVARWRCEPYSAVAAARLADAVGISPYTAAILCRRGMSGPETVRSFFAGEDRHDPLLLSGIRDACDTVLRHIESGSSIVVFGDYDVDGVCSTAIAVNALRALGGSPSWRLPSRDEGYGLSLSTIQELVDEGAKLILTVDCGITAVPEVALARTLGVDVIVTDHHRPDEELPDCTIVHPALGDYPFAELCGAGVALKLSEALRAAAGLEPTDADADLDLAGLATVCDMVPLVGENRRIAREGMVALSRARRPGLRALMKETALDPVNVNATTASFRLGPRINAAGRLARADAALELLMTEDDDRAAEIASELNSFNHERREAQQRAAGEADALCATQMDSAVIVVAGEGWHPGVVGIVASKLVELYHRPCAVISLDGDTGRGSARSIPGYDLHEGLAAVSEHLTRHGGHRMAAGFELAAENVDAFRTALATHAGQRLTPHDLLATQDVDVVVPAGALTLEMAEELERLGPFGASNPEPVLVVPSGRIEHVTAMGSEDQHARFSLSSGGARARGVAFRMSQKALAESGAQEQDVIVGLECSRWNGTIEPRVLLKAVSPTRSGTVEDLCPEAELYEGIEMELAADPAAWWPEELVGVTPAHPPRDRRGEGMAGLAGDLLSSGESMLLVVADVSRRVETLERVVAGMTPEQRPLPVVSWEAIGEDAFAASGFDHIVVLDPPPVEEGLGVLAAAGEGLVHLAWGPPEREFALSCWRERLALRPALIDLWRALDSAGELLGDGLRDTLRGHGAHPRGGAHCGRLVRVLCELELANWDVSERGGPVLRKGAGADTELEHSDAYRAYAARLADAERYLTGSEVGAVAATG